MLVAAAVATTKHRMARNVNDWPFVNFWGHPHEPYHSKLLGWFINPAADHHCGNFLLGSLLQFLQHRGALPPGRSFPVEGCRVLPETSYMDLRIERRKSEGKFTLLFENKINGAVDQHLQLSYYVNQLLNDGFTPEDVFVLYAPLDPGRGPRADDCAALAGQGVHWAITPFSTYVLPWLEAVLDSWPAELGQGMGENLTHYRNLLRHLSHHQQTQRMNREITEQLRSATTIPTLRDLDNSAEAVRSSLMPLIRGQLFLGARRLLELRGEKPKFYDTIGQELIPDLDSEFDERFTREVNLGLQVTHSLRVCYGGFQEEKSGYNFWTGYLRSGDDSTEQEKLKPIVAVVCGYADLHTDGTWYAWDYNQRVHHGNCSEEPSVAHVADTLLKMRHQLLQRLESTDVTSE